jgi:hypothetical protein
VHWPLFYLKNTLKQTSLKYKKRKGKAKENSDESKIGRVLNPAGEIDFTSCLCVSTQDKRG